MSKTYEVSPGSAIVKPSRGSVRLEIPPVVIDIDGFAPGSRASGSIYVSVFSDKPLVAPYDFYLDYPNDVIEIADDSGAGYYVDRSGSNIGLLHVVVTNAMQRSYAFEFQTVKTVGGMSKWRNRKYAVSVDEAAVRDVDGLTCEV